MLTDFRLALRRLAATPLVTLVAVLSLALGIGATVAAFSFVEATALRPFSLLPRPERVVRVRTSERGQRPGSSSYPAFAAYRDGVPAFAALGAYQTYDFGVQTRPGTPAARTLGAFASAGFFRVLGVEPFVGRFYDAADERPGAPPVVVLSHALWRERFASDPAVVGRAVTVNGHPATVIGIAPPGFGGADLVFRADVYVPLGAYPRFGDFAEKLASGNAMWLSLVGRLRDGATAGEAAAQLAVVGARLATSRVVSPTSRPVLRPFDGGDDGSALTGAFAVLLGATAVVLLAVCANVAALLLVRGLERARDAGVRAAVGAARWRLAREALAEALVLAAVGCGLGVAAAAWGGNAFLRAIPTGDLPFALRAPLDGWVLAAAIALGTLAAASAGLAPAVRASRADPAALLRTGGRGVAGRRPRLVGALVTAQLAFAVVALVTAGLFARTYDALRRVDTGLRAPARVLVAWTDFGFLGRRDAAAQRDGVARAIEQLRAVPGVRAAAASDFVPLGMRGFDSWTVRVPGYAPAPNEPMNVPASRVTPAYFDAVGTPVVRGRGFTPADAPGAPRVVVVSEAFARRFLAGRDPVGAAVSFGGDTATIVGVARDAHYRDDDLTIRPRPFLYEAYAQRPVAGVAFVVRTDGDPLARVPVLRRAVAAADAALPLTAPVTLEEWSSGATLLPRIMSTVLGALGVCALGLAAVGVFGVVAYAAAQRRREVGVRVALGATTGDVIRVFVGDGVRLAALGLAAGAVLAAGAAGLVRSQLYGVSPADPVAFGGAALVLLAAALAASWLPARRAARVDPVEALRAE